jgi:hypothetical protein
LIRNACQSYFDPDPTGQNHCAEVLKRFPSDLIRWDSQDVKDGRVFVH